MLVPRRFLALTTLLLCLWAALACAQQGMVINGSRTIYGAFNTGTDSGSTDAYVITLNPPIPNYIIDTQYTFKANTPNTGACTLDIDGKGVTPIKVRNGSAKVDPPSNTICAGQYVDVIYDGTDFQMISQRCTAASGGGDALTSGTLAQFAPTTSAQLAGVLSDDTGSGSGFFTRIDGLLAVASGKTATISNTLTFTGTDGSSVAFGGGGTVAYTSSNVASATALATDPPPCGGGQFVTDIAANGTLSCSTPAGGGDVSHVGTPTSAQLALWTGTSSIQGVTTLPALNMPALTGDVTNSAGSYSTTISAGVVTLAKMANLAQGALIGRTSAGTGVPEALTTLPASLEPAHTGDVINTAGSLVLTLINIPSGTPHAGSDLFTNSAAPSSPAAGKVSVYTDSSTLRLNDKNASGVIGTTVVPDAGASNNFLTGVTVAGVITKAQANFANLSGTTNVVQTAQSNTWSTGTQSLAGAIALLVPTSAGYAPTAEGSLGLNSTTHTLVYGANALATVKLSGLLLNSQGGSTNDATSGSGADVNHTPNYSIPASYLTQGKLLRVCALYTYSTSSTSMPTIAFKLKAGTTLLASTNPSLPQSSRTASAVTICYHVSAEAAPGGTANVRTAPLTTADSLCCPDSVNITVQPVAVATNGVLTLQVATIWSANVAGNTITLSNFSVETFN